MKKYLLTLLLLPMLGLLISCEKIVYLETMEEHYEETVYTVAVILPQNDEAYSERWHRTAAWALENIARAQTGLSNRVRLNLEWIDEEAGENPETWLEEKGMELTSRSDVMMVIGPRTSAHVDIVAKQLSKQKKMMIAPTATSAELLRKYSGKGFFWSLCEPDITQCEVLLTKAQGYGAEKVGLVASQSIYGQTFTDWFAFQVEEMGMEVTGLYTADEADEALSSGADYLICVPDDLDEMVLLLKKAHSTVREATPRLLFSDIALDPTLLSYGDLVENVEGVSPYADPASGFEISYGARFGTTPSFVEVQLYDALMLSAITLLEYDNRLRSGQVGDNSNEALNGIMCELMATEQENGTPLPRVSAWSYEGMYTVMHNPGKYNISGASGSLDFDVTIQSPVTHSVYCHWMIYEHCFLPLDFLSSHGSKRTESTTAAWEWTASVTQELTDIGTSIEYESLESQWAVLVCGSRGWFNYRHQADILNMYSLLRKNGFSDDHIILIGAPEDVLYDERNLHSGEIMVKLNGQNLYSEVELDYSTDSLTAQDICKILVGEESAHLPKVLKTDSHANVLFYWSGHGKFGKFLWGSDKNHFTNDMLAEAVHQMSDEHRFRKMLLCCEPCYSGSVVSAVEGIPGILGFASANTHESSFADIYDDLMGVWLSDRFSNRIIKEIEQKPSISFRQLYLNLVHDTYGSHVTLVNYSYFDNLYMASPKEFFVPITLSSE